MPRHVALQRAASAPKCLQPAHARARLVINVTGPGDVHHQQHKSAPEPSGGGRYTDGGRASKHISAPVRLVGCALIYREYVSSSSRWLGRRVVAATTHIRLLLGTFVTARHAARGNPCSRSHSCCFMRISIAVPLGAGAQMNGQTTGEQRLPWT